MHIIYTDATDASLPLPESVLGGFIYVHPYLWKDIRKYPCWKQYIADPQFVYIFCLVFLVI